MNWFYMSYLEGDKMIITCVQCSKKIDDTGLACPFCGTPMAAMKFDNVGIFTKSLKIYSKDQLLDTIKGVYLNIKGHCDRYPTLGYNGAIEMAGLLLLIDYARRSNKSIKELYLAFGLAINGVEGMEWSNFMDAVIASTNIITSSDWTDSYCYLKAYYFDEINNFEFAKSTHPFFERPVIQFTDIDNALEEFRKQGMNV